MFLRPLIHNTKRVTSLANGRVFTEGIKQKNNYSSYGASKPEGDPKLYTNYEITKNPEEWKYVERYLPKMLIPEPTKKENNPSGWRPVTADPKKTPYFIERTKNHLTPIYLIVSNRGLMRNTKIRRISGDIWLLREELLSYLVKKNKKPVGVQVDELAGIITFRGDHVYDIQNWLFEHGF